MANPDWTATDLPQYLLLSGYAESVPDLTIRSDMDAGPSKVRRRFTAKPEAVSGTQWQTEAQVDECRDFYNDAVEGSGTFGGTARFDWVHPRTGDACEMRFLAPPSWSAASTDLYLCTLQLEIMPS